MKICIQEGHINASKSSLKLGTGAPGEQELTKRIGDRLAFVLREKGFEVKVTDANAYSDDSVTKVDWDLFLALHGDADYSGDGGSGFADYPEPSTDGATVESQRITKVINDTYFPEVGIVYKNRSNANTRYYYLWKYLSSKTPCVLVEMGQVQDPHDKVLLANTDLIANALLRCILTAFNLGQEPTDPHLVEIAKLQEQIDDLKKSQEDLAKIVEELRLSIAEKEKTLVSVNKEIKVLKAENQKLTEDIDYYKPYKGRYEEALTKVPNSLTGWQLIRLGVKKLTTKK